MSFVKNLAWRYATKKFDPKKPVAEQDRLAVMEAIRMAPTSFGYQPFHVFEVESKDLREELKKNAWNQPQFTDAPLLFIIAVRSDLVQRIDEFLDIVSDKDPEKRKALKPYEDMMKGPASRANTEQATAWAAKQAYIALGFGLAAAAEMSLDACPMEGFDAKAFEKILGLPENLHVQAALAVGYRAADDEAAKRPKVRFPKSELFSKK
ncbi:MAG: nitroreductase family protein [Patescibacteria group bacterium]|nr:nitroreductase family protein [Patescibacteria group bacterium]MDE1945684.1 nitroreductase family protein [Patescibacteria group bacterium]